MKASNVSEKSDGKQSDGIRMPRDGMSTERNKKRVRNISCFSLDSDFGRGGMILGETTFEITMLMELRHLVENEAEIDSQLV